MYPFFYNLIGRNQAAAVEPTNPTQSQAPPSPDVREVQNATTSGQCHTAQLQVIDVGLHNFNTCFFPNFRRCSSCWGRIRHLQCPCPNWGDHVLQGRNRGHKHRPREDYKERPKGGPKPEESD